MSQISGWAQQASHTAGCTHPGGHHCAGQSLKIWMQQYRIACACRERSFKWATAARLNPLTHIIATPFTWNYIMSFFFLEYFVVLLLIHKSKVRDDETTTGKHEVGLNVWWCVLCHLRPPNSAADARLQDIFYKAIGTRQKCAASLCACWPRPRQAWLSSGDAEVLILLPGGAENFSHFLLSDQSRQTIGPKPVFNPEKKKRKPLKSGRQSSRV